jgi:phage terminase large subunit-like protein
LVNSQVSKADIFRALPDKEQQKRLARIGDDAAQALLYDWDFWCRPAQRMPLYLPRTKEDWVTWLVLAGRGFGKTRIGAECVREWVKTSPMVNLIGATADDARDIMIEGESGILAICPPGERPLYQPSKRRLRWPNGAISLIFTADEPERLRGKQHFKLWCDEVASWRYVESWDQAQLGLRLGRLPQNVVTTTPKPSKHIRELIKDPTTVVTRGSTYDNKHNLAPAFLKKIVKKYEGTRLGRQELNAELLDDNPNALWNHKQIDDLRITPAQLPDLVRIVVGVDPAVTTPDETNIEDIAETGIVAVGRDAQDPPHLYVLCDDSLQASPDSWAAQVVKTYKQQRADRVVGEVNNGGDLIEVIIRTKDPLIPYTKVHATRGKIKRAEPIAALAEQKRMHHVGFFPVLEDQMCEYVPNMKDQISPDHMDAMVWAATDLLEGEEEVELHHTEHVSISDDLDSFDFRQF